MSWSNKRILFIILGFCLVLLIGRTGLIYSGEPAKQDPRDGGRLPVLIGHTGSSDTLERPEVAFDHDKHTKALKQGKINDCKVIKPRFPVKKDEYINWEKRYLPADNIGILLVTTPNGVIDHQKAKKESVGGKLLGYVY